MEQNPDLFDEFRSTSTGRSQVMRHKISNTGNPSYYDWTEAVVDVWAELKVHPNQDAPLLRKYLVDNIRV